MTIRYLLLGLLALLSAACSMQEAAERMAPRDDQQLAKAAIDDLIAGRNDTLAARMPEQYRAQIATVAPQMRAALPPNPTIKIVGANWSSNSTVGGPTRRETSLVYELSGGGRFALAEVVIQREGGRAVVAGFHVEPKQASVEAMSGFSLQGKSAAHYAMLAAALAAIGVTIAALARIWRSGLFDRRWLWTIGAIIGVGKLTIDWSTGAFSFMPAYVQLLSASILKAGTGPWQLAVSVPLVAIWALLHRRGQQAAEA